jgi:hypothetical protein
MIENEGPRAMFRKKVAAKLAAWPEAGERVLVLEEPWSGMSFGVAALRDQLVEYLSAEQVDLLVAAPVARLGMHGGGTLDEIGAFMGLVSDVKRRAAPLSVLLVHHENRAGRVSGAWEGDPDTLLHVQAQGHGRTRLYVEKARWSSALHGTTVHLRWGEGESFEIEEREEVSEASMADAIRAAVLKSPGGSWPARARQRDGGGEGPRPPDQRWRDRQRGDSGGPLRTLGSRGPGRPRFRA